MVERSFFWTTGTSGDGAATYTQSNMHKALKVLAACIGHEGVAPNYLNELVGSVLGANSIRISSGGGISDGGIYENDGNLTFTIASASAGQTRIDRVVLRCMWSSYQVRVTAITGTSAVGPTAPSIVQTSETTYDIMLYQVSVDENGACTLTDERVFANVTAARTANRTRTFLVQAVSYNNEDSIAGVRSGSEADCGWIMEDGHDYYCYGNFYVPADYVSGMTVAGVFKSFGAAGNIYASSFIYFGAIGENYSTHSSQSGLAAVAVEADKLTLVKTLSPSVAAGDYVSVTFRRDAGDATDTTSAIGYFMGWLVSYTADS